MASEGSSLSSGVALVNIGPAGSRPERGGGGWKVSHFASVAKPSLQSSEFTCDASDLPFQIGSYEPGQVSSQADADQVNRAQRGPFLLHTHTTPSQ